ncbi:MAG TPA: preprotein translocase subunit SecA [Candidatus Saccharimonadales bacterium]|nr:preprotein translocase subunit SecA [Candidatus Saccharimonadales bacterium]
MKAVFKKILGDPQAKTVKRLRKKVAEVNALSDKYKKMTDAQLRKQTDMLKDRLNKKKTKLDDLLPDAFALVREAADRSLGMRHYDVQLIGGMVLNEGNVAELKTGEGKTLMATLPSYLNALTGKGVHVVTVNDYLAQRDAGWMGEVHHFLGMSTGVIIADESFIYDPAFDNPAHDDPRVRKLRPCTRKEAYAADITYGTNNEFGFDYLRDNMVNDVELLRQRGLYFAIVDEVDSILIDEARTPLIISAPAAQSPENYQLFARLAKKLVPEDYVLDEKRRQVALSDEGVEKVQKMLGVKNLFAPENVHLVYHMDQSLKAETLFKLDKDYVVASDGEVIIVDEFTGRLMHGRRYNEGLHQAIEAKEGVEVKQESMTLATVSFQNYFRMYDKLSGMTGTALTEEEEFQQIYGLDVVVVPPNRPMIRKDLSDKMFRSEAGKFKALIKDVKELHEAGQPVLLGTASIQKNEILTKLLEKAGIPHEVLNAKNNEREAAIVAKAGQKGAVTVATNIAGRGTDIVLGEGVKELGGLVVIGSERHESRRIDNQLRGRCGRQGDPGMTQFYVSAEDDLLRIFQGERIAGLMNRLRIPEDEPIQNRTFSRTLEAAQKKVEGFNFDVRKHVVQYDNVMNRHRRAIYSIRQDALQSKDISGVIQDLLAKEVRALTAISPKANKQFTEEFTSVIPISSDDVKKIIAANEKERYDVALKLAKAQYEAREKEFTPELLRQVEREVVMTLLDQLWMRHLEDMDHLREGIGLRGYGQRDPLVEYRTEAQHLFEAFEAVLQAEVIRALFHVERSDLAAAAKEDIETDLTRAAANSIEVGVNEVGQAAEHADFTAKSAEIKSHKQVARKKRKAERQNRKTKSKKRH